MAVSTHAVTPSLAALETVVAAHHDAIVARQIAIAEIPAPTGHEAPRAGQLVGWLAASGASARRDAVGNVIARLGPDAGPPLAILAHLDTAFGPDVRCGITRAGPRLLGPGISDNARGLAVLSSLPALLRDAGVMLEQPIDLVATVGEEGDGDLRGARAYLDDAVVAPRAVIALDGGGDDRVIHVGVGARRLRVTITGPGGHSWSGYGGASALDDAMRLARAASALGGTPAAVHAGHAVGVTVARLVGGEAINAIPARAVLDIEMRALSESALDAVEARWRAVVQTVERGDAVFEREITTLGRRPAGALPATHGLVRAAVDATHAVGRRAVLASGSSDANAALVRGIPAIGLGAGGRAGGAHTLAEWYEPAEGARGVVRLLTLVQRLLAP